MRPDLEETLRRIWPQVLDIFYHPAVPEPVLMDHVGGFDTALIDMSTHRIEMSAAFLEELEGLGLSADEAQRGLLSHELTHYLYCPFSLAEMLLHDHEAAKVSEEHAAKLRNFFEDVAVNLYCMNRRKGTDLEKVLGAVTRKALQEGSRLGQLLGAYYQEMSGHDFGAPADSLDDDLLQRLERLRTIDFMDSQNWRLNVRRFSRIVKDLLSEYKQLQLDQLDTGSFKKGDIKGALRQVAREIKNPKDFKRLVERNGLQAGLEEGDRTMPDWAHYEYLSQSHPLKIRKKPLRKSGSMYPHTHRKWESDSPFEQIDPFQSAGKIMPGITQRWVLKEGETYQKEEQVPWGVIAMDSSGSMTDPGQHLSHAVLAGFCAANIYLANASKVAVVNFSQRSIVTPFTDERRAVYEALALYQGGGTVVSVHELDNVVSSAKVPCDLLLISDVAISNLEETIQFLLGLQQTNRVNVIYTSGGDAVAQLKERFAGEGKRLSIYGVSRPEDIPRITIGEVSRSVGG